MASNRAAGPPQVKRTYGRAGNPALNQSRHPRLAATTTSTPPVEQSPSAKSFDSEPARPPSQALARPGDFQEDGGGGGGTTCPEPDHHSKPAKVITPASVPAPTSVTAPASVITPVTTTARCRTVKSAARTDRHRGGGAATQPLIIGTLPVSDKNRNGPAGTASRPVRKPAPPRPRSTASRDDENKAGSAERGRPEERLVTCSSNDSISTGRKRAASASAHSRLPDLKRSCTRSISTLSAQHAITPPEDSADSNSNSDSSPDIRPGRPPSTPPRRPEPIRPASLHTRAVPTSIQPIPPADRSATSAPKTRPTKATYGSQRREAGPGAIAQQDSDPTSVLLGASSLAAEGPPPTRKKAVPRKNAIPPKKNPIPRKNSVPLQDQPLVGELQTQPISHSTVQSVHELRMAGANSLFSVEIEDQFERLAMAGTGRRNALIELANKIQDNQYAARFCDYGGLETLVANLDSEPDVISAFSLMAILATLIVTPFGKPVVFQLSTPGGGRLFRQLLPMQDHIAIIGGMKQTNLSKSGQKSLRSLCAPLEMLPIWDVGDPAEGICPQILSLAVLLFVAKSFHHDSFVDLLDGLAPSLFRILPHPVEPDPGRYQLRFNKVLTLTVLELYSIKSVVHRGQPAWQPGHSAISASLLDHVMTTPMNHFTTQETLVLKLALNITNNNPAAAASFGSAKLLLKLALAVGPMFTHLEEGDISYVLGYDKVYKDLLLDINLMINLFEGRAEIRETMCRQHSACARAAGKLVDLYFTQHSRMSSRARDIRRSAIKVALSFLAVLLGYLALLAPVRQLIQSRRVGSVAGLKFLIEAIQRFMKKHKDGDIQEPGRGDSIARLEGLVAELRRA